MTQIDEAQNKMTAMTPEMEKMKQDLEKINTSIMDVGGNSYKNLKESLDKATKEVNEFERTLTRFRTTLSTSDNNFKKIEQDLTRIKEDIQKNLNDCEKLSIDIQKNEEAGQALLMQMKACEAVKVDCDGKLDVRKKEFNDMKR
jgi:chromosome segregation ATPase